MNYLVWIGLLFLLLFIIVQTNLPRYAKTFYLISQTSPYEQSVPGSPKILILGDSTGYGTGVTDPQRSIAGLIGQDFVQYSIINDSKNGRAIGDLVSVAKEIEESYELILLQIGGNDILQKRDLPTVVSELETIIDTLSPQTNHLVMMTSGNVGGASAFSKEKADAYESLTRAYRKSFVETADKTSLTYVDLFLEPEVDIIANNPETYLASDGLHPSAAGYGIWYETLYPILETRLTSGH
jgi:lysophospholipase L1-like esterase